MAMLTVAGFEVPILPGTQLQDAKHGDIGRAYSGKMRSDVRASHRVGRIVASIFDTANDAGALRAILNTPGPVLIGGTLIGDDAYFHVSNLVVSPITADRLKFDFEVAETSDSPSTLLWSMHGDAPGTYTFTRSGAVGKYTGSDGLLADAAANVLRTEWTYTTTLAPSLPDEPVVLIESPAFTNLVDSDDISAWSVSNTPVITGSVSDPAGGTGAYTVEDDDGGLTEYPVRNVTFTGGSGLTRCAVFVVRENTMPASGSQDLRIWDATGAAARLTLQITAWSSGEPTVSAATGTYLGKRYVGNGYWAIYGQSAATINSAQTNRVEVLPAETAAQTGKIDVYRVNCYDVAAPPWSILDTSETKNAETLYFDFPHVPQAMCGLVDFRELEDPDWTSEGGLSRRLVHVGNSAGAAPGFAVYRQAGSDAYQVEQANGVGSVTVSIDINPSWGDRVQLAWWLYADGSVNISGRTQALGSSTWSAWTDGSQSAALALANDWSDDRLYLGSVGTSGRGSQFYYSAFVAKGTALTTTYMLDWLRARLHAKAAY